MPRIHHHQTNHASFACKCAVWAALTKMPNCSLRELANAVHYSLSQTRYALRDLRSQGHIAYIDGENRAITVLLPFYFVKVTHNDN
jgi:hypothetical protein